MLLAGVTSLKHEELHEEKELAWDLLPAGF